MFWNIIWIGVMIIVALNSIVVVPTFMIGFVRRFKKLTGRQLDPGITLVFPFIEDVLLETAGGEATTTELKKLPLKIGAVSKDNQKIVVNGTLFFRVDPELGSTFLNLGKDILPGVINAIESDVGVIAGAQMGDSFIEERRAIQDLINSILRLEKPPHQKAGIEPEDCLKYYHDNVADIKPLFKKEREEKGKERSTVEKRFGIDVETFELTEVAFSEEIMKAREQKQKAALEMKAAKEREGMKVGMIQKLKQMGMSDQAAINLTESTTGAERKIVSVEGGKSSLENAAAIIIAGR